MNYRYQPKLKNLTANDFRNTHVRVLLEDGSSLFFNDAFYIDEDDYIVVYTEHSGYHSFYSKIVDQIEQFEKE